MSLAPANHANFQHIIRLENSNIDGKRNIAFALTEIKGVGRRYAHLVLNVANVDKKKRAGEVTDDEMQLISEILKNPIQFKIPVWALNSQRGFKDGKTGQAISNGIENKMREEMERIKKIKCNRGLRHYWGLRVRGQHTKTTGRRGRTVGVSKKKA